MLGSPHASTELPLHLVQLGQLGSPVAGETPAGGEEQRDQAEERLQLLREPRRTRLLSGPR